MDDDEHPFETKHYAQFVVNKALDQMPHGLMVGRFQPWHPGHRALFKEIQDKHGRVCIGIRNTYLTSQKDPYTIEEVINQIKSDLDKDFDGCYSIQILPNITGIHWGRDVGYETGQIKLPEDIEAISATEIRKKKRG